MRIWDIRAFAPSNRLQHTYAEGAQHGIEKNLIRASWSPTGDKVAAGSSDRTVVSILNLSSEIFLANRFRRSGTWTLRRCYTSCQAIGGASTM